MLLCWLWLWTWKQTISTVRRPEVWHTVKTKKDASQNTKKDPLEDLTSKEGADQEGNLVMEKHPRFQLPALNDWYLILEDKQWLECIRWWSWTRGTKANMLPLSTETVFLPWWAPLRSLLKTSVTDHRKASIPVLGAELWNACRNFCSQIGQTAPWEIKIYLTSMHDYSMPSCNWCNNKKEKRYLFLILDDQHISRIIYTPFIDCIKTRMT